MENEANSQSSPYDPNEHTVDEVKEHLDSSDREEFDRVVALEAEGRKRKGILEYEFNGTSDSTEAEDGEDEESEGVDADLGDVVEGYDPFKDKLVPSTSLAQAIKKELRIGPSPTLKALREHAKG